MNIHGIFLFLVVFYAEYQTSTISNQHPTEKIGTWCESDDGGISCFGYTTYLKNGSCSSHGELPELNVGFNIECRWWHEGNNSCIEPIYEYEYDIKTLEKIKIGKTGKFCNKIVSMNEKEFKYITDKGENKTMYKLQANKKLNTNK